MKNYSDFGEMMVRKSLFPYSTLFDLQGNSWDLNELAEKMLENKQFLEGIYWSSNYLFNTVMSLKKGESITGKKKEKLLVAIKKYIIRACSRPTPFGIFAGVDIQHISDCAAKKITLRRGVRIDMALLRKIIRSVANDPDLKSEICFHLNNTLYEVAHQYRFLEINRDDDSDYQISSLEKTDILAQIVAMMKDKDYSFSDLFQEFSAIYERDEFLPFWEELVSMSFLVSELEASLTTSNSLDGLESFLSRNEIIKIEGSKKYRDLIEQIKRCISNIEKDAIGEFRIDDIRTLKDHLEDIGVTAGDEDQIFQVDLLHSGKEMEGLSAHDLKNIEEAILVLGRITKENNHLKKTLSDFAVRFTEKYESRAVPLLQALDADIGIGYPATGNLGYNPTDFSNGQGSGFADSSTHNLSDWLLDRVQKAIWERKNIEIKDSDIRDLDEGDYRMSHTFYVGGQKVSGENILLQNIGGFTANSILSRFAYLSPEIDDLCRQIAGYEKQANEKAIFADIVWTPDSKVSNVLRRKAHYDYEIPVFYASQENAEAVSLNDLWISVERNEIILISQKLNKRVIPILSNAHNVMNAKNPIYSFLSALQYQNTGGMGIRCDLVQNRYPFLPRISYKNTILLPAQWLISEKDILGTENEILRDENLYKYLKASGVPRYVAISFGDNELFIDIENESYQTILMDEIRRKSRIVLKEWLHHPPKEKNIFIHQFILPLKTNLSSDTTFRQPVLEDRVVREFVPGSEWLYFKIYCSSVFSDAILRQLFTRAIAPLKEKGKIKKWFFIRYLDPHFHIRLRFHLDSNEYLAEIVDLVKENLVSFLKSGVIWSIDLSTYRREIERYDGDKMDFSEHLFYLDSESFLQVLLGAEIEENKELRLLTSVANVDAWLNSFCMELKEKMDFCSEMVEHYAAGKTGQQLSDLNEMHQRNKNQIFELLKNDSLRKPFELRSVEIKKGNGSAIHLVDYIHMSVNRWFSVQQKDWEYLSYYCCRNSYARLMQTSTQR